MPNQSRSGRSEGTRSHPGSSISSLEDFCKGGHTHGECTKESESYTSPFARAVRSSFATSCTEAPNSKARRADMAAASSHGQHKQVLTVDEREARAQAF